VQVDGIKTRVESAFGFNALNYDERLSSFAFKFSLRHYIKALASDQWLDLVAIQAGVCTFGRVTSQLVESENGRMAGAGARPTPPVNNAT
jgi:hypothetical protein